MNNYIQRTKDTILEYLSKAQRTAAKIQEGYSIYQKDAMEREEKRLRDELAKSRREIEAKLDGIYHEASAGAREWGRLDGSKLTADARLLQSQGVTPEQFKELVNRYSDNYTMLDALRKYGEAQNKAAVREAEDAQSKYQLSINKPYDVDGIPGADAKMQEWDDMRRRATYFLNVADGTGFNSDFERTFATNAAQKQFDAWGDDKTDTPRDIEANVEAFAEAWGFKRG